MRLVDSGEVFGHFVIPFVDEGETRKALSAALADSAKRRPGIQRPALTTIAGECDLLLHLHLQDFRLLADLQAEVIDAHSLASSWVYAIPYEQPPDVLLPDGDLEFFIYLRVHRHYYAGYGVSGERALHEAIEKQLGHASEHLSGRVLYSLGWPDLIVHGSLAGDIQHLRRLIVSLQSLSFPTRPTGSRKNSEDRTPVFLKTITLVGLRVPLSGRRSSRSQRPDAILRQPVLFGCSQPGLTAQAIRALGRVLQQSGATAITSLAMNGTWDLIVTSPSDEPISHRRFYQAFRALGKKFAKHGIERTQTHLLTSRLADLANLKLRPVTLRPKTGNSLLLTSRCACAREDFEDLRKLLHRAAANSQLSRGLTRTISHALDMFRHTLRDSNSCCDSAGALRAHAQGLRVLLNLSLRSHEQLRKTPPTSATRQALIATDISYINDHLTEWCKRAGRVVREKTAGSAARLFLQIDSIVAQRGAIPKILMIAERIMKDFYRQLPRELHGARSSQRRDFAAILEPLGNVTSQPLMGLVSIPIRYAFALHLVVPQLWHEVGQYVFWAEYLPAQRLRRDLEISQRSEDSSMTPSRRMAESFEVDYHLRADMFADLLVFCFGFGGSISHFLRYLASLTANVAKHDDLHFQNWERQALALVHRLCFVAQFKCLHQRLKEGAPGTVSDLAKESKRVRDELLDGEVAEYQVRKVVASLKNLSKCEGWPSNFQVPSNLPGTVVKNFRGEVYESCLSDMEVVAHALQGHSLDGPVHRLDLAEWESIEAGDLVELPSDEMLQAAYREFYLEELEALLAGTAKLRRGPQFRKMATLGRSALLKIYQSEVRS